MLWANFAEIDMVKQKINRELGVLTSGIRRDDCSYLEITIEEQKRGA